MSKTSLRTHTRFVVGEGAPTPEQVLGATDGASLVFNNFGSSALYGFGAERRGPLGRVEIKGGALVLKDAVASYLTGINNDVRAFEAAFHSARLSFIDGIYEGEGSELRIYGRVPAAYLLELETSQILRQHTPETGMI